MTDEEYYRAHLSVYMQLIDALYQKILELKYWTYKNLKID